MGWLRNRLFVLVTMLLSSYIFTPFHFNSLGCFLEVTWYSIPLNERITRTLRFCYPLAIFKYGVQLLIFLHDYT